MAEGAQQPKTYAFLVEEEDSDDAKNYLAFL
jgi:hypothetical protein